MKIHKTRIIEESSKLPTELDHLQIKVARDFSKTGKDRFKLELLKKGVAGEDKVIETLEKFGKNDWIVLRNLWLQFHSPFEYDIVLLTRHCLQIFEVKNYTGNFTYENGACMENGRKMDFDIIQQTRRNVIRMQRIFEHVPNPPKVKGALIFAGENNQVKINSPVEDIEILQLTDLYEYIKRLIEEENAHYSNPIDANEVMSHLEKLEVIHPYPPEILSKSAIKKLRTGIQCARCGNFHLEQKKYYVICSCGYHESREEAIIRTACEYGVLRHGLNFTVGEILAFIDCQASSSYVRKIFKKHFKQTLNGRFTYYENRHLPYYKIHHEFEFKYPAIFYTKRSKPNVIVFN